MAKLVELLTQAGLVLPHQAHEAHQLQVVYGDRIGTNLLASGALRETALARALGALHQVPYAAGKEADSRPQFTRGIHRNVAMAYRAVPARVDEQHALVFMTDPHDLGARAHLERDLQRTVSPVVVAEARMWWLLHKFYLAPKPHRIVVLDDEDRGARLRIRPRAEERAMAGSHASRDAIAGVGGEAPPSRPHAIAAGDTSEEATAPWGRPSPSSSSGPAALSSWPSFLGPPPTMPGASQENAPLLSGFDLDDPTRPMEMPPPRASWPSFLGPEPSPAAFQHDDAELLVELAPVEDEPVITGVLVLPRDTSPLSFDAAKQLLASARDRDEIALIVLRSCLSLFTRAVLLTVQGDTAFGWDGVGDGIALDVVKDMRLPLKPPSIFHLARDSKAHFLGPLPKEKVNILFLKLTGAQIPKSALVVPVVVRGKVVNLLYCDNGAGKQVTTDIGDLLVTAQHINRSYEQLLKR